MNNINKTLISIGLAIIGIGMYFALFQNDWNLGWKYGLVGSFIQGIGLIHWRFKR